MRWIRDPASTDPCVLVLGMFDGVHRGHQALLERGLEAAGERGVPLTVCTFEPHPLEVLRPDIAPPRLTNPLERARRMAECGADVLCVFGFTRETADMEPEDFLDRMTDIFHPVHAICGYNFSFGRRGRGDGEMLVRYAQAHGFGAEVIPAVEIGGEPVSSTRIRLLVQEGRISEAARLLGEAYAITGRVAHGKRMGHRLGFPTVNVTVPPHKVMPAFGVYCCGLTVDGAEHPAVVNVGRHPTLPEGPVTIEAHALRPLPELYGEMARVRFLRFLRPEQVSPDTEALSRRIAADSAEAEAFFAGKCVCDTDFTKSSPNMPKSTAADGCTAL